MKNRNLAAAKERYAKAAQWERIRAAFYARIGNGKLEQGSRQMADDYAARAAALRLQSNNNGTLTP